jgi:hypothetical protein
MQLKFDPWKILQRKLVRCPAAKRTAHLHSHVTSQSMLAWLEMLCCAFAAKWDAMMPRYYFQSVRIMRCVMVSACLHSRSQQCKFCMVPTVAGWIRKLWQGHWAQRRVQSPPCAQRVLSELHITWWPQHHGPLTLQHKLVSAQLQNAQYICTAM